MDEYNPAPQISGVVLQWFSRFTAALFALLAFALIMNSYYGYATRKAMIEMREEFKIPSSSKK